MSGEREDVNVTKKKPNFGQYSCVCCGQRYWKGKNLVRRAAHCKGKYCRAWRCRFNDQCPQADQPCPLCGTYKRPEFQPAAPAEPVSNPNPASDVPIVFSVGKYVSEHQSSTFQPPYRGQPESSVPSQTVHPVPRDPNVTALPPLEGKYLRYLTEV